MPRVSFWAIKYGEVWLPVLQSCSPGDLGAKQDVWGELLGANEGQCRESWLGRACLAWPAASKAGMDSGLIHTQTCS